MVRAKIFAVFLGYLLIALSASDGVAAVPTAKDFATNPTAKMMTLSPDGQKVAYISRAYESICRTDRLKRLPPDQCDADERVSAPTDRLVILDVSTEDMRALREVAIPDDYTVNWLQWSSDDTLLLSINTRWVIGARYYRQPIGRIISVKVDGSRSMSVLFGEEKRLRDSNVRLSGIVDMLRDDPDHVLMGANRNGDYDLFKVNVDDGTAERVAKGRGLTRAWFTDKNSRPVMRWDCKTELCRDIEILRLAEGDRPEDPDTNWQEVRTFEVKTRGNDEVPIIEIIAPSDNPDHFYVEVEGEGHSHRNIKVYDIRKNSFVETVFSDEQFDIGGTLIDSATGDYAGAYLWRDRIEYHLVDDTLQAHIDAINAQFNNGANVTLVGYSDQSQRAIVHVASPNDPGGYYLFTYEDQTLTPIVEIHSTITSAIASKTDIISIPTRDGATITAYHTRPDQDGDRPGDAPLILLIHGGPEARDHFAYERNVQFLASRGYQVLQINFRGSSGYGRAFAEAGYREWGGRMHDDVIDATQFMTANGHVSPGQICVMGHSYGGYAALLAGARQAELYACVIAGSGPSDLHQSLKDDRKKHGRKSSAFEYWTRSIGDMKADRAKLDASSPVYLASQFDDPVLLLHGEYDQIVDVEHSRSMNKALERAGKSVEYVEMQVGHHHARWSIETSTEYFQTLEKFLKGVFPDT